MTYTSQLTALRNYFNTGITKTHAFRKQQLQKLKAAILNHEQDLYDAMYADLKKSPEETWVTETGMVIAEINEALRKVKSWMQPQRTGTTLVNLPSSSRVVFEPMGVVLIIGPWN
ncbi:MAG TPA: aldehyde dehydrogenase family protein, partial [Chitinophagaceae bacterium]|nr:aldehyde dehydrogenase family protein [Chitinophagaceae bacterium]